MRARFWARPSLKTLRLIAVVRRRIAADPKCRVAFIVPRPETILALRPEFTADELERVTFIDTESALKFGGFHLPAPPALRWIDEPQ